MQPLPPIEHVRRDFVAHLYSLGRMLDYCIRPGHGSAILGLASASSTALPSYDDFDLSPFPMASGLHSIYRYAAYGEIDNPRHLGLDPDSDPLGQMRLLVEFFDHGSPVAYCLNEVEGDMDSPQAPRGGFKAVVERAVARATLDQGLDLAPQMLSLLAGVTEKSVANAMAASSDGGLRATRSTSGGVSIAAADALPWLTRRHAFVRSVWAGTRGVQLSFATQEELGAFIRHRMQEQVSDTTLEVESLQSGQVAVRPGLRLARVSQALGGDEALAAAWLEGRVEDLRVEDCDAIGRLLLVDARWLRQQLASRMPAESKDSATGSTSFTQTPDSLREVEAVLSDAGIRNGYVDIERRFAERMFPSDAFGGRSGTQLGRTVRLQIDGTTWDTDFRVKSQAVVSPRRRMSAYFKSLGARPQDRLRFTQIGEREFQVTFIRA